ncbi:MAG: glycosyltransferase family 4 protein, partial [Verrucomicrobia bacterium]|nr:glycosyltransferase family 4 protein [Verrucomicrobiota bacterium]
MTAPSPRFAFVSGNLNLGGSTTFLCNIAGELVRRGVSVRVFCTQKHHPLAADFESQNIPVFTADERRWIYEDRIAALLKELRAFEPTLVAGCLAPASFEILRYLPPGIRRVGMVQSDDPGVYGCLAAYREKIDAVVGVSKTIAARLQAMEAFAGKQIACIPYGVPMPASIPAAPSCGGPLRILYLGRLDEDQKRVRLFPEIYRHLCASGIPFRWTLAGEGPERAFLEAKMSGGGPDQHVLFTGQVDYANVPLLLQNQDVLLLTSTFEGLPLSLLEAMGQGLVPVVSDLESGIREVVDEINGLLVPVDNIEGYARALVHLHKDREELTQKRTTARARVFPAYSIAAMADRWMQLATEMPQP